MDVEIEGAVIEQQQQTRAKLQESKEHLGVAFAAGLASGCAGIVVGQPFDTIKVRLQTAPPGTTHTAHSVCRSTVAKEGVSALFKGMGPPLASAAMINAVTFATYAQANKWLLERRSSGSSSAVSPKMTMGETFAAGSIAGACQMMIVLPADNIKTKLQVQVGSLYSKNKSSLQYKGSLDCIRQCIRTHGLRSLAAGGTATVCREIPAYGVYFSVYEKAKETLQQHGASPSVSAFTAGGLAGCSSWFTIYPFDVIKSTQQAMANSRSREATSMVACAQALYAQGGIGMFTRGLAPTIARAFPVNAVIFPVYEWTVRMLQPLVATQHAAARVTTTAAAAHSSSSSTATLRRELVTEHHHA